MRENRQAWVHNDQVRGEDLRPGNVTTLRRKATMWALRKWDGGRPIPAGAVVTVVETRPYGSLLVAEMLPEEADSTRRAIEKIRADVKRMRSSSMADEYADECRRLTLLTDRFPVEESAS